MRNPGFLFSLCTALCGCTTPTKELVWEALSPPMGPTTGGTEVQVSGKGFSQDTVVAFDGVAAETLRIEGEELLVAKLPARLGRAGFVDVQLSSPIDTILRSRAFQYYLGKVQFSPVVETPATGEGPFSIAADDLNADGIADVVTANYTSKNVSVLIGRGDGIFLKQTPLSAGKYPYYVSLADVDGDGAKDIITGDYVDPQFAVLYGKGDGTFLPAQIYPTGAGPRSLAVADVNGV
ncbi:MAG TPA: FG-GAP-like repeat-containing protein [Pseudomonadota bacterium]|nr:FG-GAP-like repeat-containing protein [Pseudomonadota bacterium]